VASAYGWVTIEILSMVKREHPLYFNKVDYREELMCSIEVIRRENKKNKKLQVELNRKRDTQELEQMITKLKVQIEEDKRIEEALKEQLEEKEKIIGNLEAEVITLRNDIQKENM
jgi:thiamine kinase-like enzyme